MNLRTAGLLAVAFAGTSFVAPAQKAAEDQPADLKKFEGRWKLDSLTVNGKPYRVDREELEFEFKDTLMVSRRGGHRTYTIIKLEPAANPRRMTTTEIEPPKPGDTKPTPKPGKPPTPYLYAIDGDTLTLAGRAKDKTRLPDAMESKPDSDVAVMVLKRITAVPDK